MQYGQAPPPMSGAVPSGNLQQTTYGPQPPQGNKQIFKPSMPVNNPPPPQPEKVLYICKDFKRYKKTALKKKSVDELHDIASEVIDMEPKHNEASRDKNTLLEDIHEIIKSKNEAKTKAEEISKKKNNNPEPIELNTKIPTTFMSQPRIEEPKREIPTSFKNDKEVKEAVSYIKENSDKISDKCKDEIMEKEEAINIIYDFVRENTKTFEEITKNTKADLSGMYNDLYGNDTKQKRMKKAWRHVVNEYPTIPSMLVGKNYIAASYGASGAIRLGKNNAHKWRKRFDDLKNNRQPEPEPEVDKKPKKPTLREQLAMDARGESTKQSQTGSQNQ